MNLSERYANALANLPRPGGNGCHVALLGVANLGVMCNLTDRQIVSDIRKAIPSGGRVVPDSEIEAAVKRSRRDTEPMPKDTRSPLFRAIVGQGMGRKEADITDASPTRLMDEPQGDWDLILRTLYQPTDYLFCGDRCDTKVYPVEWMLKNNAMGQHIIPNPMTGTIGKTKDDKDSFRADSCVKEFRYAVVEFDNISRDEQIAFWWAIRLPVVALIDSGGKSIHGWIKVECRTAQEWTARVENGLYAKHLIPMGVDSSCKNEARLSRTPGWKRGEKWQRLLYLCPQGRPVHG